MASDLFAITRCTIEDWNHHILRLFSTLILSWSCFCLKEFERVKQCDGQVCQNPGLIVESDTESWPKAGIKPATFLLGGNWVMHQSLFCIPSGIYPFSYPLLTPLTVFISFFTTFLFSFHCFSLSFYLAHAIYQSLCWPTPTEATFLITVGTMLVYFFIDWYLCVGASETQHMTVEWRSNAA